MERNRKTAPEFYDLAINNRQHNPLVGDGKEGFKEFLAMLKKVFLRRTAK
jgi:predicted SnoaL-like aldol condensation-catalyzing enzyme